MRQSRHLSQWLKGINPALNTYATDFEEEGYENLGLVLSMSGAEFAETLEEIGILKHGHQKLLNKTFARLLDDEKVEADDNGEEEEEDKDPNDLEISKWLKVNPALEIYAKDFEEEGYENVGLLLNNDEAEFAELLEGFGPVKPGHQKMLNKTFARLLENFSVC
uniref:SAM domain-containing protein n=1 Tax=Octactis speculum TaxID=3111310 RepID=A0A7S2FLT5_9STRA|mmetsp:Transcript_24148/g.33016  ORF Transcript_24148/g.33016 Transcript_24148/m.33016 type:complete len:164 (+) Transcript_24148:282-773(+)